MFVLVFNRKEFIIKKLLTLNFAQSFGTIGFLRFMTGFMCVSYKFGTMPWFKRLALAVSNCNSYMSPNLLPIVLGKNFEISGKLSTIGII